MDNWELFKVWLEMDNVDIDRLSWTQISHSYKDFVNEEKQNSFSYQRALKISKETPEGERFDHTLYLEEWE